jgi:membrane protease YdiL (CAAX protease family)
MTNLLPWICVAAWAVGAFLARHYGVWIALGTTGLVLGTLSLVVERRTLLDLPRRGVGWGLLGGLAMTLATYGLYPPIATAWPHFFVNANEMYGAFNSIQPWRAVLLLVPIIACEELVWRGVVQTSLAARLGPVTGALVAAIVYGLAHAPTGSPVLVVAALGCGLVWSFLRMTTGGIVAPLVAHLVWDFAVLLVHPLIPKPL